MDLLWPAVGEPLVPRQPSSSGLHCPQRAVMALISEVPGWGSLAASQRREGGTGMGTRETWAGRVTVCRKSGGDGDEVRRFH